MLKRVDNLQAMAEYCLSRGWAIPAGMALPPLCVSTMSERSGQSHKRIFIYSAIARKAGLRSLSKRFFVGYTNPSYGTWRIFPVPDNVSALPSGIYVIYVKIVQNTLSLLIHESLDYFGGFPEEPGTVRLCRGQFLDGGGIEITLAPEEYEDAVL